MTDLKPHRMAEMFFPTAHCTIQDGKLHVEFSEPLRRILPPERDVSEIVYVDMTKPRITPERSRRLHATIAELREAMDTEKQLEALKEEQPKPGNALTRLAASIKRRFGRCK